MGKQCDFCFQFKDPLVSVLPNMPTKVCKACAYKIQQVTGFLMYHNASLTYQPELSNESPQSPLKKRKSPNQKLAVKTAKGISKDT